MNAIDSRLSLGGQDYKTDSDRSGEKISTMEQRGASTCAPEVKVLLPFSLIYAAAAAAIGALLAFGILAIAVAVPLIAILALIAVAMGSSAVAMNHREEENSAETEKPKEGAGKVAAAALEAEEPGAQQEVAAPVARSVLPYVNPIAPKGSSQLSEAFRREVKELNYLGQEGGWHYFETQSGAAIKLKKLRSISKFPNVEKIHVNSTDAMATFAKLSITHVSVVLRGD
jgi:membrane protein implicated in regulation of membrane protease activity